MSFKCKKCGVEVKINYNGHRAETVIVICPSCGNIIEKSSCYGFGPVWPACIFKGEKLVAELCKINGDNFQLKVLNKIQNFEIPSELRNDDYKRHFEICNLIINRLKEEQIL